MNLEILTNKYLELLNGPLKGLNLTRILIREDFFNKQVMDSVIPVRQSPFLRSLFEKRDLIIDVGFGGGFPLFPLGNEFLNKKIVGIESIGKKVNACKLIRDFLELTNVRLINSRLEKILIDSDAVVTFKAVGKIKDLLDFVNVQPGCSVSVLFYKGPGFSEETSFKNPNWKLSEIFEYKLADNSTRATLLYENVPRGTFKNKNLVKLSELILQ